AYKHRTDGRCANAHSWKRIEDNYRLIGSRHDGFGDGDQAVLLVEDPQARKLRFACVQLSSRSRRRLNPPGLNLREADIELRAVADFAFHDGQHVGARQIWQQAIEADKVIGNSSGTGAWGKFFEFARLIERKFSNREAGDFGEMPAAAELLAHFVGQRADIRAGRAFDHEAGDLTF